MQQTIVLQVSADELKEIVKNSVDQCFFEHDRISNEVSNNLLSLNQASNYLHLARQTLYGFTSQRKIPFLKKGKKLYFKKTELDKWLNQGTVITT
jgi:excisionase family DNA binding protein